MPAPTMYYTTDSTLTPEHRAQLLKTTKKLQKILGVAPTISIIPSSSTNKIIGAIPSAIRSCPPSPLSPSKRAVRTGGGKLLRLSSSSSTGGKKTKATAGHKVAAVVTTTTTTTIEDDSTSPLSSSSSSSSSSASASQDPDLPVHRDLTPRRRRLSSASSNPLSNTHPHSRRRRPSVLNLVQSNHFSPPNNNSDKVIDISPASVTDHIDIDSPQASPRFMVNLPNRATSLPLEGSVVDMNHEEEGYEDEEDDVLTELTSLSSHRPLPLPPSSTTVPSSTTQLTPQSKKAKLSRLAKHFGTQPPLELIFPPSPTSQSRRDPKRYTFGLPPPLVRGSVELDLELELSDLDEGVAEDLIGGGGGGGKKATLEVVWDRVEDEKGRMEVMDVLRQLKA